ncbi:NmrA family transcriptional regulator [bacterium 336/3]|nr:NmrA family transcriptional regulator [bacterium 336/3]
MKSKVLIMLATGKTGYASTVQLLQEGYSVRIYVRSKNEKALALEKLGAEIALGDFDNKQQLQKALKGIQNVYYCYPYKSGMAKDVNLFIETAKEANIHSVVFMGQRIAEFADTGSAMTADVRKSYELLKNSGLNVVYFAPGYFADNVFVITEFVLQLGLMPNPFANGKNPWISIEDMARCIVALLKNPEPYFGQKLFPTGSKSISPKEMVNIFSKVSGRKVTKVNIPDWLFFKAGIMSGMNFGFDKFAIIQSTFYNKQMQINRFDIEPTDIVKKLTGREPEDFETITRQYFDNSPFKYRTFSTWLTTFIKFNKMPFTKVPSEKERVEINR